MSRMTTEQEIEALIAADFGSAGGVESEIEALIAADFGPQAAVPAGMAYGGYLPGQVAPRDAYAAAQPPTVSLMPGGDGQIANIVRGLDRGVNVAGTQVGGAMAAAGNFLPGSFGRQLVTQGEDYAAQQAMMRDQTAPTTTFLGGVAEAVPGLVGAVGTGLATGGVAPALGLGAGLVGTAVGAGVAGAQSGGGQYVDAMQRLEGRGIVGDTARDQAAASAAGTGAVSAVTSVIPMGRYLSRFIPAPVASGVVGRLAQTRAGRIVMDAAAEGSQEAVEEIGSMVAQDLAENDPNAYNEFAPRLAQAFGAGAVLGGVVGGAMDVATGGGPEARARQAAALRERSVPQPPAPAGDTTQTAPQDSGVSSPSPAPATPNVAGESALNARSARAEGAPAAPDAPLSPETIARIEFLYDELSNRPDMPDAERNAMEAEYAQLTGDPEYEAPTAEAGSVALDGVRPADQGGQLANGAAQAGAVSPVGAGLPGVVAANGVETGVQPGNVADQRTAAAAVPTGVSARPADVMAASVADMSGAELRARARELGVDDRGPISVVRRRVDALGSDRATDPATTGQALPQAADAGTTNQPQTIAPATTDPATLAAASTGVLTANQQPSSQTAESVAPSVASQNPTPTRGPRRGPAPSAPVPPTPAQAPAPAPAQSPATSQQSPTRGGSATAATGTVSAGRALDENRSTVDADLADFSRRLGAPVTRAEPTTPLQRKMVERLRKLGRNVVFVNDGSKKFNGVASNRDARTVYIRADADQKTTVKVLAHELLHSIVKEDARFADRIAEIAGDAKVAEKTAKYRGRFVDSFGENSAEVRRFDRDGALNREEGLAQFLEDAAEGDLEAARLLYETPGLLARLRQLLNDALERIGIARATPERRALNAMFDRIGVNGERAQQRSIAWAQSKGGTTMEVRRRFAKTPEYEMGTNARDVATMQTDDWSGAMDRMFSFPGKLPTDIRELLEGQPIQLRRLFQENSPNGRGADAFAQLGADRYMEIARAEAGLGDKGEQIDALRNNPDPENQYVAAVAQAARETGRNTTKVPIAANALQPGDVFRVNGKPVRVLRDENERMVLVGRPFRGILVEGLTTIPIDTGTHYREGSRGNVQTVQEMGTDATDVPSESSGFARDTDVPFSPRSMFDRTDDAKGTGSDQGSLFGIPANARATTAPKLTLAEKRELYPGIKPNETVAEYEKRMGTADTPMMFAPLAPTIDVDGVQRPTTNSNGQPIAQDEASVRNFWRWFGASRVVDEQGRPRVVYHGTDADFGTFVPSDTGNSGPGIYTTDNPQDGSEYATDGAANVKPLYMRMTNPVSRAVYDVFFAREDRNYESGDFQSTDAVRSRTHRSLVLAGYDGRIVPSRNATHYVAFDPSQVKSATGNLGTFDPANPDIRFSPARGMSRIEQRNQERADRKIGSLEKRVETEREKAESAKAAARATISVLQTQLRAAGAREKGLTKVVGILETMRARQEARADEATAENQARATAMKQMRETQRQIEQIKDAVVRAVRDALPQRLHGQFITDIRKVKSASQLPILLSKIEKAAQENRARDLDVRMARLTGVRDTRKLADAKVRDTVVGARSGRGKLKALTESSNTRDVAKKAMSDFVLSAKAFMDADTNAARQQHLAELDAAFTQLAAAVEAQKAEDNLVEKNRMRAISDVAMQVVDRLASMPVSVIVRAAGKQFGSAANHGILWVTGLDNIGNMIDGTRTDIGGGTFSQTIVRPIQEGQNQAAKQVKQAKDMADDAANRNGLGSFAEAFATLFGSMGDANTATYKLTIPIGGKTELRAWEALKLAAMDQETLGHVIGLDRPLFWDADGEGFTVSWQQYDALMKVIPDNHLAFMQDLKAIRDLGFDAMASEVKKLTGTEPPKVFGYDKITVHPDVSAKWNVDQNASLLPTGHVTQSLENLGITKARESNKAAMLVTNFGEDWLQTVDTQARVTHLAAPIRNMKELLRRNDVSMAIKSRISPYALDRLQTIADDVGGTGMRGGREGGEFTRRWLKYSANKNKALTALNLASVARNGAGVMTLLAEMDVRVWSEGIARVMSLQSDSLVDLMDKSDLVTRFYGQSVVALQTIQTQGSMAADAGRDRAGTAWEQFVRGGKASAKSATRAAADLRGLRIPGRRVGAVADFFRGLLDAASNAGTMFDGINMIHYVSTLPACVAWEGFKAEAARRGESEAWAIQQTERAVSRTQAVPDPAELTALQSFARGTPLQPFTSFGTDAARMVNMILRAKITGQRRGMTAAAVMMAGLWSGAVTGLFSKELLQVLFGTDDEEDRRNLWQKAAADAVRDSIGGSVPGISDRFVEAVKAYYTVRTPGAAESQLLETPVSSGITNFAGGIGLLVSAVDEGIEGDDKKGRTPGEKALKSAEMMLTEMLEASGVPLPSVYRQGKRVVTAATEKKDAKK